MNLVAMEMEVIRILPSDTSENRSTTFVFTYAFYNILFKEFKKYHICYLYLFLTIADKEKNTLTLTQR